MSEQLNITLPRWLAEFMAAGVSPMASLEERMQWVVGLSGMNVRHGSGGPFAAAVFDSETSLPVAAGVNIVTSANASIAHAEVVALTLAQQSVGSFDLGARGLPEYELVSSSEPCCMCFGAILWSGVRRLSFGARAGDVCRIGFDEGPKPADWIGEMERRGIRVRAEICRQEAVAVLHDYQEQGGLIYNARQG